MAEACRLANRVINIKSSNNQNENFSVFNVLCVFISLISILADLTTDVIVFVEYCKNGRIFWASGSFIFIFSPNIIVNVFSMRWYTIDQVASYKHWLSHGFLVGLLERYITFLHKIFVCKNWEANETQKFISQRNDLSLLHFLYIFTGTVPQIILQLYAIIVLDDNYQTKVFALSASIASVIWSCATYIYSITVFSTDNFKWNSLVLQCIWHFCMLISRVLGVLLCTIILELWTFVPLSLHWLAMTIWIITQKTSFCPNKLEEILYNAVMGFVYCFFYINLREGHSRYRLLLFYTLMVTQNFGSLFLYVLLSDPESQKKAWSIATTTSIILGTVVGIAAMILYYRFFHSTGPILWKNMHQDIELNNKSAIQSSNNMNNGSTLKHVRSFKKPPDPRPELNVAQGSDKLQDVCKKESENAYKNFLLDHWIARSGTPTFISAAVGHVSMDASSIEVYSIENTPQPVNDYKQNKFNSTMSKSYKKRTVCAPTAFNLKLSSLESIESSIDEITSSNLNLNKRRGICASDELREEMNNLNLDVGSLLNEDFMKMLRNSYGSEISHDTEGSNKKTSSDSIDMDLDLSFSDINSSDINTFNENIVQKLCLSALKNIKVGNQDADIQNIQRIALDILKEMYAKKDKAKNKLLSKAREDTPTEVLSVHDYENMCAVNIAREAWGLRSWKGYTDIENWVHDGSVVRDRRRDTLTSGSSEVSSCISQDLKNAILTAQPFPKKSHTYSNVFVKFDRTDQDDYANTVICQDDTFLAKPCIADLNKDLNHLEPILEELDDLGDIDPSSKKRLNSESSLVATIDEIRKCMITNSPRNVYHRREATWDSVQFHNETRMDSNHLRQALWKEPSKFDSSNIMNTLRDKNNMINDESHFKANKSTFISNIPENAIPVNSSENNTLRFDKNTRRRKNSSNNNLRVNSDPNSAEPSPNFEQLLWQLVSEDNDIQTPTPLLFLKKEDSALNTSASKITNARKNTRSRPRRKFSILRDRFEPKSTTYSDEEALFRSTESILNLNSLVDNSLDMRNKSEDNVHTMNQKVDFSQENVNNAPDYLGVVSKEVKEKHAVFTKQVLSPHKFNTKLKYKA